MDIIHDGGVTCRTGMGGLWTARISRQQFKLLDTVSLGDETVDDNRQQMGRDWVV